MKVEQIYTGCLSQGAYYIESDGEVAIIDPLREVQQYIDKAEKDNAEIKYIFETHFHADFVSGHVTLAELTGASIIYGPNANPKFDAIIAMDGQEFKLGKATFKVLHTPGHTMESTTYLLKDESGKDLAIFSGDTLFLGDVGRPDLAQKAAHMTQEDLAGILFDSLRNKIMPLSDDITVYPAHGAGSACGKNMMKETIDTLGNQKKVNYALRADMTKDEFVKEVTDGLTPPPSYFPLNVKLNREGYENISEILEKGNHGFNPDEFELIANESGAVILDVRTKRSFADGHVPKSIFIGLDGSFAPWVGALIKDVKQAILLVADENRINEAVTRLSRVGFDNTIGYLKGGVEAWRAEGKDIDTVTSYTPVQLQNSSIYQNLKIIDVRKPTEYASEHIENAENAPLDYLNDYLAMIPKNETFIIHCASGYRSLVASSILKARGYHNMIDVDGGIQAMKEGGFKVSDYVCPSTL